MKFKHLFLLLASAAFVALSCEKNNENKPDEKDTTPVPEISVVTTAFPSIADAGGTLEVTISSNVDWTLSIPEAASWLSANPASGAAGEEITITFTASANEAYDKRSATVTVSGENKKGSDSEEFTVSQKQKDALILSDDEIEVGYEGETINIVLQANSDISYAIAEDAKSWIVPVQPNAAPTKALVESTVSFNVLANTLYEAREGVITFTNAAGDETVTVKQAALPQPDPELAITPAAIADVAVEGAEMKLALTSNMPWVVSIPDGVNWLSVSPTQGAAGENVEVTVTIQANAANDGRSTNLTFTCTNADNKSKEVTITVAQKGLNISPIVSISNAAEFIAFASSYNSGTYAPVIDQLAVTLTGDIAFDETTSAAFPGIGSQASAFKGAFDGADHTVSGLVATAPIFPFIAAGASVKNLTIDNTCSFTFTHPNTEAVNLGSVAGYLDGALENVKVAADVTLAEVTEVQYGTNLGGIVGQAWTGSIKNCEYSGLISAPAGFTTIVPTNDTGDCKLIIGGLAGSIGGSSSIDQSNFKGAINNAAQITSTDDNNPYLIIGGVAGYVDCGATVMSCATTADHADEASAYDGFNGKIVNKTSVAYHSALGGVVGELNNGTVSSCTNAATIAISIYRSGDNCRYMETGGIVGKNNADGNITGCINNGSVQHRSNPKYQNLGGIAGFNAGAITNCTNNAAVNQMTSGQSQKAGRYVRLGGVIGENIADNKVSNVHNTANVEISSMEDNADGNSTEYLGGVIGYNKGILVGGESKDITNSGQVYHSPNFTNQFAGFYVGGIAGLTEASIKNAKNTGRPYFRWQGNSTGASKVYMGGIAGKAVGASSTIENCENTVDANVTNSAQVYLYLPGTASHKDNYVGGIVGFSEANNPVKNCTNGGEVRTAAGASTTPVTGIMMGGIIGKMTGSGNVDNADNSGRVRINFVAATDGHSGNYLGGIVGYVVNDSAVNVTGCDNSGNVDISNNKSPVEDLILSGVVGRMDASGTISNCNNKGGAINMSITAASVAMNDLYVGGVLGKSEKDVTITGCSNTGAISGGNSSSPAGNSLYVGGIAAYMKGASKILNCSNTGSTVSTQSGNNDSIGTTTLTGGIAGYVEGTSENPIEIGGTTGCTVNTSKELSANRGWIGGVAAYAKYAQISKCTIESIIGGGCAARGAGGIVGKAEYCTISSSSYKGDQIKANQIQATTGEGGIVGNLDNSTIDGCSCYATKFYNVNSQPFGCIVGISGSNNTIQNCHYKASVEGPTAGTAATAMVAGSGTFSGENNVADL